MLGLLAAIPALFADDVAPAAGAAGGYSQLLYLLPVPIIFYFIILRPQQEQDRKRKQLLDGLKKNDKVLTSAGIYGTVVSVDSEHDKILLRVDDEKNVRFTFSRASIVRVVDVSQEKASEAS